MNDSAPLTALALACTLKPSPSESSSEVIAQQLLGELARHGVTGTTVRVVDHDVRPGVELDMGDGDTWPEIRAQIVAADILIISTPTWMGQQSSVCQRVLERLDAELSETGDDGQLVVAGTVAIAAVVGNEDGAHHISGIVFSASTTSASPSRRRASPTGTVRPCTARTSRTWRKPPRGPPPRPRPPRPTPPTWPGCGAAAPPRRSSSDGPPGHRLRERGPPGG